MVADRTTPRPYGRRPVLLRGLAESIQYRLERELRASNAIDSAVHVKAFWLRADDGDYGWADYAYAYVWIAPVVMSPALCEQIEPMVAAMRGVVQTGRGGKAVDTAGKNPLRPFVYAVVDRREEQP